jgi:hypothetical protein
MKTTSTGHKINQPQGPRTGNTGTPSKRTAFMDDKAASGNEKSALADMVTKALETRGRGMQSARDASVEGIKSDVNVGRGPRRGNTGKR